jgi:hypothetical protein
MLNYTTVYEYTGVGVVLSTRRQKADPSMPFGNAPATDEDHYFSAARNATMRLFSQYTVVWKSSIDLYWINATYDDDGAHAFVPTVAIQTLTHSRIATGHSDIQCLVRLPDGRYKLRSYADASAPLTLSDAVNGIRVFRGLLPAAETSFYVTCYNYIPVGAELTLADVVNSLKHYRDMITHPAHLS